MKICFIIPYFGKLPNNFDIFLNSCKYNKTINYLLVTDDKTYYEYPDNFRVEYMSFDHLKNKIQNKYDFKINLSKPYKLCDFKPAYGDIFNEYLSEYDFWGYCDIDIIFGNIRKFITNDILEKYDKILSRGHFTLYRNNEKINKLYKSKINNLERFKQVFSCDESFAFDEWGHWGINYIFKQNNIRMYDEIIFRDIYVGKYGFYPYQLMKKEYVKNNIYLFEKGSLFRLGLMNNELIKNEILYVHFQKRNMEINGIYSNDRILIAPNKYIRISDDFEINKKIISEYGKDKLIYKDYIVYRIKNLQKKIQKTLKRGR
jgi:hypothetical protein